MHVIRLDSETDFDGWRKAARALALNGIAPRDVTWTVCGTEPELFDSEPDTPVEEPDGTFNVPAKFIELAKIAILHELVHSKLHKQNGDPDEAEGQRFQAEIKRLLEAGAYKGLL